MPTRLHSAALVTVLLAGCAHGPTSRERKSAEIQHDLGVEALRNGRAPDALKAFDDALRIDDRFAEAWLGKGLVLERAFNKDAEAERAYRRALEINPAYAEAWTDLGQLLARTGKTDEALQAFDAALSEMSNREPWVARFNKGLTLYWASRRDEGLLEMRACLRGQPAYCEGHRLLGSLLLGDGKVKEAIDEFKSYVRYCDRIADAHFQLGAAYMKAGDAEAARTELERCVQLGSGAVIGEDCRRSLEFLQ
jgi:Tfp pilus assembly protein PilF